MGVPVLEYEAVCGAPGKPLACAADILTEAGVAKPDETSPAPNEGVFGALLANCVEPRVPRLVFGSAVPPATEAIASGVAVALGGAGYVFVGPAPASASAEGSLRRANMLNGLMLERHPSERHEAVTQAATSARRLFASFESIPAYLEPLESD